VSITIGSLFSGIGGLELGLERATGGRTVWQVEQDAYCRTVLAKHWPEAERFYNVRHCSSVNLVPVELICGGFPCQDISLAGTGAGLSGARSGLWSSFARIVGDLRPRFVVVENVSALRARGLGTVLRDLAALGYDAAWDCIPAAAVGAPHRRDRLFVVAHAREDGRERGQKRDIIEEAGQQAQRRHDADGCIVARATTDAYRERVRLESERPAGGRVDVQAGGETEPANDGAPGPSPDADKKRREEQHATAITGDEGQPAGRLASFWAGGPTVSPVRGVDDGLPPGLARRQLAALGNAVVPQVAEVVGRAVAKLLEGNE
jgi:DNA (cytosine-5)-methyltransferase 1